MGWAGAAAWRRDQAQAPLGKPLVEKDKLKRNLLGAIRPTSTGLRRRGPSFASASPLEMLRGYLAKRERETGILGLGGPESLSGVRLEQGAGLLGHLGLAWETQARWTWAGSLGTWLGQSVGEGS